MPNNVKNNDKDIIDRFEAVKVKAARNNEVVTDVSVRAPFSREDYELFHPNEMMPRDFRSMILACRSVYTYVGVVRNVYDLMTDFATEDLTLLHKDPKIQAFFKVWSKKVDLFDAAQEFARHFLVDGNVVMKRVTAKLTVPVENQWQKAQAKPDQKELVEKYPFEEREIPFRYIALNLLNLKWIGGPAAKMANKQFLTYDMHPYLGSMINAKKKEGKEILDALPLDMREHIEKVGPTNIPLDMNKIFLSYNKKDSWEPWATPQLVSVLKDVKFRDKLRQAETSALDGTINAIRLWKIGDYDNEVYPSAAAIDKLVNILNSHTGGGTMDLVWDASLNYEQFYPPLKDILGSDKYEQVNKDILVGLGVPEVLIGGKGSNFSNAWIQLKTLVEKLKVLRCKLVDWINTETSIVSKAMGFDSIPIVRFNYNNLQDDSVKQKLIVSLFDRGIISGESVLNMFNEDWEMEVERLSDQKTTLKKNGLEIRNPLPDPNAPVAGQSPIGPKNNGRPPGKTDTMKRDSRKPKVRSSNIIKGLDIIDIIDEVIIPKYMDHMNVENARKLTNDQKKEINNARLVVLSSIKASDNISAEFILEAAQNNKSINKEIIYESQKFIDVFMQENGKLPTLTQRKRLEAIAWAKHQSGEENG